MYVAILFDKRIFVQSRRQAQQVEVLLSFVRCYKKKYSIETEFSGGSVESMLRSDAN